ncbi:MAG TPA: ParB/Srx family N-terminal domain-containing protein, partial [Microlunatus sp.]|nr:ParB/Srx family N-terminal domain-containing protein [Microlunatus sp.]
DPERRPADRRVRLSMVSAPGGESVLNTVTQLAEPATTDDLFPILKEVTDGHGPTKVDLVLPAGSQFLTIEPPTNEAVPSVRPSYTFDFAGRRFAALASATPRQTVGELTDAGFTGGVLWNDIRLGAYEDRFRLTLQPRAGGKAVLAVSPLFREAAVGGEAVEVDLSGVVHFQVLESGPLSIDLDLTGDRRPDLSVYDQLSTPDEVDGGGPPQRNRNHQIRLVGSAVGGERAMSFRIRDGFPMRSGSTAATDRSGAANAVAVGAINEQARGAATFSAQIDQYEAAMMKVRKDAADGGTIRPDTYRAWAGLSRAMIKLRPQTAETVQPALQSEAAAAARDLFAQLTDETRHTQSLSVSQAHTSSSNRYTGEERLTTFGTRVTGAGPELAGDIEAGRWDKAFDNYQRLVSGLDNWIVDRLRETRGEHDPALEQAEFLTRSREQLAAIDRHRPTRVLAVFQPDEQFRGEEGFVDHVPLNLYYYQDGGSWYLKNLSNPNRPHHYSVDVTEGETVPPASLFAELDDPDRLPAGVVHYDIPGVKGGQVTVTPRLTWRKFLTYLGVGLAVAGLVLSAGTGAVAVAGAWALAGSAVAGGVAAALDLADKASHGDLDATTAIIDIAQIVAAIAGVGALAAGRAARAGFIAAEEGAPLAGRAAATAVAANRIYVVSAAARISADVVTVAAMTVQAAEQMDAIENAPGSREDKDRAKALLLAQLAVTGGLTALSIRGELPAIGDGRRLVLRTPRGETVAHAFVEGAETTTSVRFSQKDIGGTARGGALTVEELADEYRRLGYTDEPIRVVELPDGTRVTLDNRRLYAARQASLSDIPVEYHPANEPFPAGEAADFVLRDKPIREVGGTLVVGGSAGTIVYPKGAVPATYGEAALFRTANQGNIAGGGGRFPLGGRTDLPRVRPVRTAGPAGGAGE